MEKNQIAFLVKADIPNPLPFKNVDTCSIFANALDNAIEYCSKSPVNKREIQLETYVQKVLFALKITNPYIGSNTFFLIDSFPKTSKKDTLNHGYGLKSIRETVLRCGGHMEIRAENNEFMLFIYIPLADK